jgi:hypothetical protein
MLEPDSFRGVISVRFTRTRERALAHFLPDGREGKANPLADFCFGQEAHPALALWLIDMSALSTELALALIGRLGRKLFALAALLTSLLLLFGFCTGGHG